MKHKTKTLTRYALLAGLSFQLLGAEESPTADGTAVNETQPEGPVYQLEDYIVTGTAMPGLSSRRRLTSRRSTATKSCADKQPISGKTLEHLPSVSSISTRVRGGQAGDPRAHRYAGCGCCRMASGVNYQQFGVRHPPNLDPFLAGGWRSCVGSPRFFMALMPSAVRSMRSVPH